MSLTHKPAVRKLRLQITIRSITIVLIVVALAFVFVSLAGQIAVRTFDWHPERDIVSFTNIDRERNLPTTFQTLLLLGSTIALAGIAVMKRLYRDRWTRHWGALSMILLLMAWDEIIEVHERFIEPMRRAFDLQGFLFFGWIIPAAIVAGLVAVAYLRFVLALPRRTRVLFVVAAVTFLAGALVMEGIGGAYYESIDQNTDITYVLFTTIEETLEMAGMIVLLHAALSYLSTTIQDGEVRFAGKPGRLWIEARRAENAPDTSRREVVETSRRSEN